MNGNMATSYGSTQAEPGYASFAEAENVFMKVLRRYSVQPDWTWEQTVCATVKDPQFRSLKDPKDRRAAFEKYTAETLALEKERAKERLAKLRTDFSTMLRSHPEIKHYSRWKTVRPILEGETIFRSTNNEDERRQLFAEYILELRKAHSEKEAATRKTAKDDLASLLNSLNLEPYTRWAEAQDILQSSGKLQADEKFKTLSKGDLLNGFESQIKSQERSFNDVRQQQKTSKARRERQTRDAFICLLQELKFKGDLKAGSKWMNVLPIFENDPRYTAMLGQAGSSPLDLFWDVVEEQERALRGPRNDILDVLYVRFFFFFLLLISRH